MSPEHERASFRNHPLRRIQAVFERRIQTGMESMYRHGMLANTQLEQIFKNQQELHPDDITLAGLEFTIKAARAQVRSGVNPYLLQRFLFGSLMNASDGAYARHLHMQSPEGAVNDVSADRVSEIYIAELIAQNRAEYPNCPNELDKQLNITFQLSTLTKAACEMASAHTGEAGVGGMIERRINLVLTLINLGSLNTLAPNGKPAKRAEARWLKAIDARNKKLIDNSYSRARERAGLIRQMNALTGYDWNNPALNNPWSAAAVEARKYVAIIQINEEMSGINMVDHLNSLNEDIRFPAPEDLIARYPYIGECLTTTQPFRERLMSVVYDNS